MKPESFYHLHFHWQNGNEIEKISMDTFHRNILLLGNHLLGNENEYVRSGIILHNGNGNVKWLCVHSSLDNVYIMCI